MAMKVESMNNTPNQSWRIKGDLGDLQISEDTSDGDDDSTCDKKNVSRTVTTFPSLPSSLVKPSTIPAFGSVAVTNSENVQFGNNTYFNGPVTIKQVIQDKSGLDNPSFKNAGDEVGGTSAKFHDQAVKPPTEKLQILVWHKVILSAICVTVIGGIIAMIVMFQNKFYHESTSAMPDFSSGGTPDSVDPLIIAPGHLRIVSRSDWLAQPVEGELDKLIQPVPWIIITHTATESCNTQSQCILRVRLIQQFHIESRGWYDIGYNFMVGGDGSVYYGRGWDYEGAHTKYYNKYSIGIAFIGTFNNDAPPKQQVEACQKLIQLGVSLGKVYKDYRLLAHRQLMSTLSPGDKVFDIIKEWPHFVNNYTDIKELLPPDRRKSLG